MGLIMGVLGLLVMSIYIYSGCHRNGPFAIVSFFNFSEINSVKTMKSVRGNFAKKVRQIV